METRFQLPDLPDPAAIRTRLAELKVEIVELRELLRLAEVRRLARVAQGLAPLAHDATDDES